MNNLTAKRESCFVHSQPSLQYIRLHAGLLRLLAGVAALLLGSTLHAATLTRTSSFTYDANGMLVTETIEPGNAALSLVTTYTYDAFGNKIKATVSGNGNTSRTTTTTYDAQGRFPVTGANALGHTESRVFDPKFGVVTQVIGPNGLPSPFTFDTFGRPVTESGPDGVAITTTRGTCPATGCPALAAYYVTISKPGRPTATAYFDKFNRQLRTQNVGFNVTNVLKDTSYDNLGRVYQVSQPYYSGAAIVYTTYSYDLLNRVTAITDPQGNQSTVAYSGLTTTGTNAKGQTHISVKNSQGQQLSATDALNHTITYTYDPFGNLLTTTDPAGNVTTLTYDLRGRKTGMNDPDMGVWSYTYDVLGELVTQTDAKGQVTINTYDLLGRMTHRAEPDLNTTWVYDTATPAGIGKLASSVTDNGQTRTYIYDSLGRLTNTNTQPGTLTAILNVTISYDSYGRVDTRTTPAGFQMQNIYNANGYLSQVQSLQVPGVFPVQMSWTATALSADEQLSGGTFGNGVTETRTIDNMGRTTAVNATDSQGAATVLGYTYDALGNLLTRLDTTQNLIENYTYDALNRITGVTSSNPNQAVKSYAYDALGNITSKSDTGTYTYAALRANGTNLPHAVSSIVGSWNTTFTYDANGNAIAGGDRTYVYTSFNLPASITRNVPGGGIESILYGVDHERAQLTEPDGSVTISLNPRLDSGTHYDQIAHPNGVTEDVNYFYADNRPIGIYSINANGANGVNTVRYFHVDSQGSIVAITSGDTANAGAVVERLSYDAWGKRRNADGTDDATNNLQGANTDHGYTGQEHLDPVGLIHMSGRVYDPRLGRFIQADPTIQAPGNLQSYNRYTYVMNNPFFYTDPSGYSWLGNAWHKVTGTSWSSSRDQYVKPIVVVVVAAYLGPEIYGALAPGIGGAMATATQSLAFGAYGGSFVAGAISGAAIGAISGGIMGGTVDSAIHGAEAGAVTGGVFASLGAFSTVGNWGRAATVGANSLTGGAMARVQGGDFAKGMENMFITQAAAWGYEKEMGYAANPKPGTNDPNNTIYPKGTIPPEDMNTIGHNWVEPDGSVGFFDQGGTGSRILNNIFGFNALSKPHDVWTDTFTSSFSNAALMVPAAAFTYMALMPAPLTAELSAKPKY